MCDENNNKPLNMAPKTFLLLALAFAIVILISSQIAEAKDLDESE